MSGPAAFAAAEALAGRPVSPRDPRLRWLRDPDDGRRLDQALVLGFRAPASFTGEDTVELQLHGSTAVCGSVLAALARVPGLRPAEAGEFTRRALLNGRLDLAQVEGLGDLIAAETAAQQRQALQMMDGGLSRIAAAWRDDLVHALALVEASIDFADEDLPDDLSRQALERLSGVRAAMQRELEGSRAAERIRDGFEVALVGRPNVGKSTLLNAIARRDVALTSDVPGTTRDVIEVRLDLGGLPVTLLDMAGLREGGDVVEGLGIARARSRAESADLRVFLVDDPADIDGLGVARQDGDIVALSKADRRGPVEGLAVSGTTGTGVELLLAAVSGVLERRAGAAGAVGHARQRSAVAAAASAVERALGLLQGRDAAAELASVEIHGALGSLDFLVGKVDVEAVLDVVFRTFCLGK